ncbi:MAG TPA: hypothetical protein VMR00_05640 [Streptosporangiaceae bacterium]|jgi:hypothetical protein|nr:hypothetical protein [Streptosporangiaceae bacterium]
METAALDFAPWGLDADWPARRWIEPIHGRRDEPIRGVRLGHANDAAMVLTCTYPRRRFDADNSEAGSDAIREIAFETTYAQINLALHQIRTPGARPDGLIGSLVRYANQQADRYRDWPTAHWGVEIANTTRLASWQSGFSVAYPDAYVIVHACGVAIDRLRLVPTGDLGGYEMCADPLEIGAMHWELWPSRPELGYDDLARTLVAH